MSTLSAPFTDSRIMLRRNFKHILRNPVMIFNAALMPVVLMLLLVYVFGNAFNVGEHYVEYATPGLIVLAISYGLAGTAVSVNSDMTKGIINRFKVMNVSRGAVLTGHVAATMATSAIAIAVIIGMAFALGFRSPASPIDWLGAIGIAAAAAFAAAWLTVGLGMAAKTPESAGMTGGRAPGGGGLVWGGGGGSGGAARGRVRAAPPPPPPLPCGGGGGGPGPRRW